MHFDLVVILGPTASGKSDVAMRLAKNIGGEIVSADSMQIYRGMDIGTAKPTPQERSAVPMHGIDLIEPDQEFTVVDFQQLAEHTVADIQVRGGTPIICGGTGFYIRAFLEGFAIPELPANPSIRQALREEAARLGSEAMHRRLAEVDPEAAARILPGDEFRIVRALEVFQATGEPISKRQTKRPVERRSAKFGLSWPREELVRRIDERTERMLSSGWIEETRALVENGYDERKVNLRALGYRQLMAYLRGEQSLEVTAEEIKRETRRYAKRQMTWFRKEPDVCWLDASEGVEALLERMLHVLHS